MGPHNGPAHGFMDIGEGSAAGPICVGKAQAAIRPESLAMATIGDRIQDTS